jgi:hypothetical protein
LPWNRTDSKTPSWQAYLAADRARGHGELDALGGFTLADAKHASFRVTASFGVAVARTGEEARQAFQIAWRRWQLAKALGGNRVEDPERAGTALADPVQLRRRWWARDPAAETALFASVAPRERVEWAISLLAAVRGHVGETGVDSAVLRVTEVGRAPDRWSEARRVFGAVRQQTLAQEQRRADPLALSLLLLAEAVCKVIYNASESADPFDVDAGMSIPSCAREVAMRLSDPSAAEGVWTALVRHSAE